MACAAVAGGGDLSHFNSSVIYQGVVSKKGLPSWKSRYVVSEDVTVCRTQAPTCTRNHPVRHLQGASSRCVIQLT